MLLPIRLKISCIQSSSLIKRSVLVATAEFKMKSSSLRKSTVGNYITNGIIFLICVLGLAALQFRRLNEFKSAYQNPSVAGQNVQDQAIQIRLRLLDQIPTFGFDNLFADWTFLEFLQYFGDEPARRLTGYQLSPDYFDLILKKDPYFLDAYLFLTASTTLYAGQPERTVALMNEKLPLLSPKTPNRAYYIWRWKAIDELLFLGDTDAARESFLMAAQWASEYSDEEGKAVAEISRQMGEFLASNPENVEVRLAAWSSVFYNAFDDRTRQYVIEQINQLGFDAFVDPEGRLQIQSQTSQ
jgi:hypothetical protein